MRKFYMCFYRRNIILTKCVKLNLMKAFLKLQYIQLDFEIQENIFDYYNV